MKPELLEDVYMAGLEIALKGEQVAAEAMPEISQSAPPEMQQAFERHTSETQEQIKKLQQCLKGFKMKGEQVPDGIVMEAAVEETRELLREGPDPELAAVIIGASARKIEHIEIACYSDLISMAKTLGLNEHVRMLSENLKQEQQMERDLAGFAENALEEAASLAETAA
jgi:ferritin-like metal-binding protein YciE